MNGTPTAAQIEAVRRATWAERAVRDGVIHADQAAEIMLSGLGTLLADLFDDLTDFTRNDIKARKLQNEKILEAKTVSNPFYEKVTFQAEKYIKNLKLDALIDRGDRAGAFGKTLKTVKIIILHAAAQAGLNTEDAKQAADLAHLIGKTMLSFVQTQSAKGALKPAVKEGIQLAVKAAKPLVMDSTVLPSYCGRTKADLQTATDEAQDWSIVDDEAYAEDRTSLVRTLTDMGTTASGQMAVAIQLQGLAQGLDNSQDFLDLVGKGLKWAKVAEKVALMGKYLSNAGSVVIPHLLLVDTLPRGVKLAVYQAYGQYPPTPGSGSGAASMAAATEIYESYGTLYSAAFIARMQMRNALADVRDKLVADQVEAMMMAVGDAAEPTSYIATLRAFSTSMTRFQTLLGGLAPSGSGTLGEVLGHFMAEDMEIKADQIRLLLRLRLFLFDIEIGRFTGSDDAAYQLERDAIAADIFRLLGKIDVFMQTLTSVDSAASGEPMFPVLGMEIVSLVSEDTGLETITQTPETFALSAQVTNYSGTALSDLTAHLELESPLETIAMITDEDLVVGSGSLAPGASATVTWRFEYSGTFANEFIPLGLSMLEASAEPASFAFNEPRTHLIVDPSKSDADDDELPDDWETAFGLAIDADSSALDPDEDGLDNLAEYELGTNPTLPDTDDGGLEDGEETSSGADGFKTDPLNPDSDADGTWDGADGQPLDASTTGAGITLEEGEVDVALTAVALTSARPFASVGVADALGRPLTWTATVEDGAIASVAPMAPDVVAGSGLLTINASYFLDFSRPISVQTKAHVFDVLGATNDTREIAVLVIGDNSTADSDGDGALDVNDGLPLDPTSTPEPSSVLLNLTGLLVVAALARARRQARR
jgi:hypothetical protein